MKKYWNIYFKAPGMDPVSIPTDVYARMESDIMGRHDVLLRYRDMTFNPRDVRYTRCVAMPEPTDTQFPNGYPAISEEQRQKNLKRLAVLREVFFAKKGPVEEGANPYSDDDIRSTMNREERRAWKKVSFDRYFESDDAEQADIEQWLPIYRGQKDPRNADN